MWSWTIIATLPGQDHFYQKTFGEAEWMLGISVERHVSETGEWSPIDPLSHWRWDQELPRRPLPISERRAANQTSPLWQPRRAGPYLCPQTHLSGREESEFIFSHGGNRPVLTAPWTCDVDHRAPFSHFRHLYLLGNMHFILYL